MNRKEFINQLFNDKAKNDSNSQTLTRTLKSIINTGFGSSNHFVLELLQNADDSLDTGKELIVELRLLDKYLIFSHSGKHFNEKDIRSISDVCSGDSGKDKDQDKTGYKGIGFKSIFAISNKVYILSNGYNFKFDRYYDLWKETEEYPWQIIPIWVEKEEIENEVIKNLDDQNVNTIISVDNTLNIKDGIMNIFDDPQIMLFLRNIAKVVFYEKDKKIFCIEKRDDNGLKTIYVDGIQKDTWIYKEFLVDITEEVREKIIRLDDTVCPDKLKHAKSTKITLATIVNDEQICKVNNPKLYCYLPTEANYGFNYLVNADFITNLARTDLIEDNDWNAFIFNKIARCSLLWITELVKDRRYKYSFTKLIKEKYVGYGMPKIKQQYNAGLEKALEEVAFIPKQGSNEQLLKIKECIIDNTKFFKEIDEEMLKKIYGENYYLVDDRVEEINKLCTLGAKKLTANNMIELFDNDIFKNKYMRDIEFNIKILKFICENDNKLFDFQKISSTKFILSNELIWETPRTIYFSFNNEHEEIIDVVDIKYICSDLFNRINQDEKLINWLKLLGVREASEIDIFRKSIIPIINNDKVNIDNAIIIGQFIFRLYKKKQLTESDYQALTKMKLLTILNHVQIPEACYLADYYNPKVKLQNLLNNGEYISPNYINKQDEISEYKALFLKIGVRESIRIHTEESIERMILTKKYPMVTGYFNYIDMDGSYYDEITRPYIWRGQHGIKRFLIVDYIEYTNNYDFSIIFWKELFEKYWEKIRSYCGNTKYYTALQAKSVISYLKYYAISNECIPGNDSKCYKATELYSSSLEKIIGNEFPIVNQNIKLTKEQENILGIRNSIGLKECYILLNRISKYEFNNDVSKQIEEIYKQMVNNKEDKYIYDEEVCVLTTNHTYQPNLEVYCFNIKEVLPPAESKYFLKISDSFKDKKTLCNMLKITLLEKKDLKLITDGLSSAHDLKEEIIKKLKYFVTLTANILAKSPQEILKNLIKKIATTEFIVSKKMFIYLNNMSSELIYKQVVDSWYDENEKKIFYVESIKRPLTLYSLANSLESFFEISGKGNEIALLLQLNEEEAEGWLTSIGYKITEIDMYEVSDELNNINISAPFSAELPNKQNLEVLVDDNGNDEKLLFEQYEEDSEESQNNMYENNFYEKSNINHKDNGFWRSENIAESTIDEVRKENHRDKLFNTSNVNEHHTNNMKEEKKEDTSNHTFTISNTKQNPGQNKKANQLLSYVYNEQNKEGIHKDQELIEKKQCRKDASDIICNYEVSMGRKIEIASDTQEGYDLFAYNNDNDQRYIKFFEFWDEWNNYDMPLLSKSQIEIAKEKGDKYWLYIVENLLDKDNARIYRIRNPYNLITKYAFDSGWKGVSEKENPIDKFVEGAVINHTKFGYGTIKRIKRNGKIKLLIVDFDSGEERLPLNLKEMSIREEK